MRIKEIIVEPDKKIYVGSIFKIKIKVEGDLFPKRKLITENVKYIKTQDGKNIRMEWSV